MIKGSPHPNAAKAFAEFMISDSVQKLFPGEGIYAARVDVEPPPGSPPMSQIKLWPIDYDYDLRLTVPAAQRAGAYSTSMTFSVVAAA